MRVRLKRITIDDEEFKIGALTFKQRAQLFGGDGSATWIDLVCASLNNALPEGAEQWSMDRLVADLDPGSFEILTREIIDFNEIQLTKPDFKAAVARAGEQAGADRGETAVGKG